MSSYVVGSLIGVAATVVGGLLAGRREAGAHRNQQQAAQRADLRAAMSDYLAAVDTITAELSDHPAAPRRTRVEAGLDRLAELADIQALVFFTARLLQRLVFGRRHEQLLDRLASAASRLRLIATPSVDELMRELETARRTYQAGDQQWLDDWLTLRNRVRSGFKAELDELDRASGATRSPRWLLRGDRARV